MTLFEWSRRLGLRDAALARRLGVSQSWVSRLRSGRVPSPEMLQRVFVLTGGLVTPNDFYPLDEWASTSAPHDAGLGARHPASVAAQ